MHNKRERASQHTIVRKAVPVKHHQLERDQGICYIAVGGIAEVIPSSMKRRSVYAQGKSLVPYGTEGLLLGGRAQGLRVADGEGAVRVREAVGVHRWEVPRALDGHLQLLVEESRR